jgi:hypothetical protein
MCGFVEAFAPAHTVAAVRAAELAAKRLSTASRPAAGADMTRRGGGPKACWSSATVCSFKPIYPQGMTVAALEALALRDCFPRRKRPAVAVLSSRHKADQEAWQMAAGGDLSLPEIEGTPTLSTRLLNGYVDRVLTAAEYDTAALEQFVKVA